MRAERLVRQMLVGVFPKRKGATYTKGQQLLQIFLSSAGYFDVVCVRSDTYSAPCLVGQQSAIQGIQQNRRRLSPRSFQAFRMIEAALKSVQGSHRALPAALLH